MLPVADRNLKRKIPLTPFIASFDERTASTGMIIKVKILSTRLLARDKNFIRGCSCAKLQNLAGFRTSKELLADSSLPLDCFQVDPHDLGEESV
jgi:hypothetical protein